MNSVNLIGRWVREHEVINGNTTVVKNTLAVDHPYKKDDVSFIRVVMFGKTGELANQYTTKGSQVAVVGHIQTGSYEKSDGSKVYTTDVSASSIKFLEPKSSNTNNAQQAPQQSNRQGQTNTQTNYQTGQGGYGGQAQAYDVPPESTYDNSDDLPF